MLRRFGQEELTAEITIAADALDGSDPFLGKLRIVLPSLASHSFGQKDYISQFFVIVCFPPVMVESGTLHNLSDGSQNP